MSFCKLKNLKGSIKKSLVVSLAIISCPVICGCCFNLFTLENMKNLPQDSTETVELPEKKDEKATEHPDTDNGIFSGTVYFEKIGNIRVPGQAIDVNLSGNYAYLTNDLGILYVIDIYDKENPVIVGKCTDVDSADIVIVKDGYAYVSYTQQIIENNDYHTKCGFKIVDISDAGDPRVIGDYNTSDGEKKFVSGFYIDGDFAYLNTHTYHEKFEESSMEIVDVKVKKKPLFTGVIEFEGIPSGVFVKEGRAFINVNYYDREKKDYTAESRLLIIDVTDQGAPVIKSSTEIPSRSWGIYVKEDHAYITSHSNSEEDDNYRESFLSIFDISVTGSPVFSGRVEIPGGAWEIDLLDDYVFVSALGGGLFAVDISDKKSPFISDRYNTGGTSYDIGLLGNYGYLVDGFDGLEIVSLSNGKENLGSPMAVDEENGNFAPVASIEISGDISAMHYQAGNPVYFSAAGSFDPDGGKITYNWFIDGQLLSEEESAWHVFEEAGTSNVKLVVSDGALESSDTATVRVAGTNYPVSGIVEHDFIIEIEYMLVNKGPVDLTDIECHMRVPQSYYPYQTVNNIDTNISGTKEVFDNNWNKLINFVFEGSLSPGKELSAVSVIDITAGEFDYLPAEISVDYDTGDEDYIRYTSEDLFIDSENPRIKEVTESLAGNEDDPLVIAEILYNFVARNLSYDYERAADGDYPFYYASEILERGSGVCADYAILYTALLRSAGIPSRLAAGVPVYTTLHEKNREIELGHAWVEMKLPGFGWIPVDITTEEKFWSRNYFLDITTERGPGYLYENTTMDWTSYYYDGFKFEWDGDDIPEFEQKFIFRIKDLETGDIIKD